MAIIFINVYNKNTISYYNCLYRGIKNKTFYGVYKDDKAHDVNSLTVTRSKGFTLS